MNKWSLDELAYGLPSDGPYQTNLPSLDDIISTIRIHREGQVYRIRHEEEIDVHEYQILTREILSTLKPWKKLSRKTFSVWGGFAQILDIPCEGACIFTDKWSLDELAYGVPTDGPYQTNPPSPDDIIWSI
nr:hypothetical protein [Tanacetum cinerariifolium]